MRLPIRKGRTGRVKCYLIHSDGQLGQGNAHVAIRRTARHWGGKVAAIGNMGILGCEIEEGV